MLFSFSYPLNIEFRSVHVPEVVHHTSNMPKADKTNTVPIGRLPRALARKDILSR
jgi:hypothetical protein